MSYRTAKRLFPARGGLVSITATVAFVVFAVIQLYPLVWMVLFSLKDTYEIHGGNVMGFPQEIRWDNYRKALSTGNVGVYLFNSVVVTAATILISGILAAMASYALVRMKWRLQGTMLTVFLLGLMIPLHAALLPLFIMLRRFTLLNTYWALIIPYTAFALPRAILIYTGFLESIPREMEEAAFIDGCSIYRFFFVIMLPVTKPVFATISVFTFLDSWNELMFAVTFITKDVLKTLPVGILALQGRYAVDWGQMGAGLTVATIPSLILYIALSRQVQHSIITGALKG